jgi:LEA14-like dessication related protein
MIQRVVGRMGRARAAAALVVVTTAFAGGCASLGRAVFQEPVVSFRSVQVRGLGLTGGEMDVVLNVYNPNRFRLDGTRLTYRLFVDSVSVGEGQLADQFAVQSGDSTEVRLPVRFTYNGIGAAGRQLLQTGAVNYRVAGDLTVGTPLGDFTRPYDRTGRFNSLGASTRR